jgi:predicted HTH domain antitoxin
MKIELPDDVLAQSHLTEHQLKLELALFLYQKNILTLESAARFAELDTHSFQSALGANKIPMHYNQQDLEDDLKTLNEP